MNRRGFIGKAMAALAGLFVAPLALWSQRVPWHLRWTGPFATGGLIPPAPRRRVLVMDSWWIERDDSGFSMVRSDIATQEMREANPFKPRKAIHWRYIQFEELRKGDHFRLIDEVPEGIKSTGNEDGKTV